MSLSQQSIKNHIIIDPERLIKLKKERKAFKMVPSIYQPPQESQFMTQQILEAKSHSTNKLNSNKIDNNQFTPYQKVIELRQFLSHNNIEKNSIHPNVEYIWSLLPQQYKKDIHSFQQGDCIPQDLSDRWLVLQGEVKIIGINNHWYSRCDGYMFFASKETAKKVKQVVAVKSTKLLKIKQQVFKDYLKTYVFLKNSQKIKFLKYCPFFIWKNQLTEDLVLCMDLQIIDRDQNIYVANSKSDAIYFVKEGIVLLQRNTQIFNPIIKDYELHYQKNQVNERDAILVVRKGMAFGIDGIILKQIEKTEENKINNEVAQSNIQNNEQFNPQNQFLKHEVIRKSTRVYNAKTIGNTQVYTLKKQILETLFNLSDVNDANAISSRQVSSQQLERMSLQYTNMIVNHTKRLPRISLKKTDFILPIKQERNESQKSKQRIRKQFSHKSISLQKNAYKQKRKTVAQDKLIQDFALKQAPLQKNQMRGKSFTNSHKKIMSKQKLGQNQQKLFVQPDKKTLLPTIKMEKILKSQKARQIFESKLIKKQSRKRLKRLLDKSQSLQKIVQANHQVSISYQKSLERNQNPMAFISIKSYKSIINLH